MAGLRRWVGVLACLSVVVVALAGREEGPAKKGAEGIWEGSLKVGKTDLRLVVRVSTKKDGKLAATFDSPDQGARGIAFDSIAFEGGKLKLEFKLGKATFEGKANKEVSAIEGEWKQGGQTFPLTLKRVAKATELARPQHPKKPYPYREEEVTFKNKKAGLDFTGTLTLPRGKGPFPAVVLITGSGPQDRDETILGHKPFLVLADHLTRKGIAVLRVDDRGVGGSGGSTMQSTTADFVGDALSGVTFLKGHKEINARQIGLVGHSEGGIVAPLAAAQSPDVAFIVLLAGTGVPGEEILYQQGQAILKASGATASQLAAQRTFQELMVKVVKEEKDKEKAKKLFERRLADKLAKLPEAEKKELEKLAEVGKGQFGLVMTPWFAHFLTCDPRVALGKVRVPVLALGGEKDTQVPPKENLKAIKEALEKGGNKNFTVKELPGLNHLFQTCKTGSPTEYAKIEETFAPSALKEVSDWILKQTKKD